MNTVNRTPVKESNDETLLTGVTWHGATTTSANASGITTPCTDANVSDEAAKWLEEFETVKASTEGSGAVQIGVAVTGRLQEAEASKVWRASSSDPWLHDVRENGLQLPLINGVWPPRHTGNANCIKTEYMEWTRTAINELVQMGSVATWEKHVAAGHGHGDRPHCVMPLLVGEKGSSTPEALRLRLIHDCRFMNFFIEKRHFTLEKLPDYLKQLCQGDKQIVIDITSAYHHVEIAARFRTLLGFWFEGQFYVYNCLPFGLAISAYVFCMFTAITAESLRKSNLTAALMVYIDDFLASIGQQQDESRTRAIVAHVRSFGWHLSEEKLDLRMGTCIKGLGFILDTSVMTVDLPEARRKKLVATAKYISANNERLRARVVCKLIGQIQSCQPAWGLVCRIRSRYLTLAALPAARAGDYSMFVSVTGKALEEVKRFEINASKFKPQPMQPHYRPADYILTCDASVRAVGAIVTKSPAITPSNGQIFRELHDNERGWGSTLREMTGYAHAVATLSRRQNLSGAMIEIVGDSQSAGIIFGKGGSQVVDEETGELLITEALLRIFELAEEVGFEVRFRWVRREALQEADDLSKFKDRMDFSLIPTATQGVRAEFGPWDIDRYAATHNTTCGRFNSLFDTERAEAVDALSQDWCEGLNFVLPYFHAISKILDHIERCNARTILIVPEWPKAHWWPRLWSGAWARRLRRVIFLATNSLRPNNEFCFFGAFFLCRTIVLELERLH